MVGFIWFGLVGSYQSEINPLLPASTVLQRAKTSQQATAMEAGSAPVAPSPPLPLSQPLGATVTLATTAPMAVPRRSTVLRACTVLSRSCWRHLATVVLATTVTLARPFPHQPTALKVGIYCEKFIIINTYT